MTNRARPSDYFIPMPIDRSQMGQNRVDKIQKKIEKLEREQQEKRELIDRLSRMQKQESQKGEINNNVINRTRSIASNLQQSKDQTPRKGNVRDVISDRTREFTQKQKENEIETRYLIQERERLQQARLRIQEQKRALLKPGSPSGSIMSEPDTLHRQPTGAKLPSRYSTPRHKKMYSVDDVVKDTIDTLPDTLNRIASLRENVQKHYEMYKRPYNGEMGIKSYKKHQIPIYFMVRAIVDDVVNEFLDSHFRPALPFVEKEAYYALAHRDERDYERAAKALSEKKAVQLIMEEVVLDVTSDMVLETIKEEKHVYLSIRDRANKNILTKCEAVSTGIKAGRKPTDQGYNIVTKQYYGLQQARNKREGVWSHTQPATVKEEYIPPRKKKQRVSKPEKKKVKEEEVEEEEDTDHLRDEDEDPDVEVLEYHHITTVQFRNYDPLRTDSATQKHLKQFYKTYMTEEVEYWANFNHEIFEVSLPRRCKGIHTVKVSPSTQFVAVGTIHGDCIVYDSWMVPWRPFKVIVNNMSSDDPIINISWSLDSQRLTTINISGSLQVWSLMGGGSMKSDPRKLGIPADVDGMIPRQLGLLFVLDNDDTDFMFKQGPNVEQEILVESHPPTVASFYPSFTFAGVQNETIVALKNGDMLKCNLEFSFNNPETENIVEAPKIINTVSLDDVEGINVIGKGVEAELMRRHKFPVILITYVDNINKVISVDVKGYIIIWRCDKEHMAASGWFVPFKVMRLASSKEMYTPVAKEKPKVLFTDYDPPKKKGERTRTRQEIANQRHLAETNIENMVLGDPWHKEIMRDKGIITYIYAPKGGVAKAGAMFHIISRHLDSEDLAQHVTRLYKPVRIQYTKLFGVESTADGKSLVFVVMFPEYPPKDPHLTVVVMDLLSCTLKNFRRDIDITDTLYEELNESKENLVNFAVSRTYHSTGSEYLFLLIKGDLKVISLTTGRQVVKMEKESDTFSAFSGLIIDSTEFDFPSNLNVVSIPAQIAICSLFFGQGVNKFTVLKYKDESSLQDKHEIWDAYKKIKNFRHVPRELRTNVSNWKVDDNMHILVAMRSLVLECMDKAITTSEDSEFTSREVIRTRQQDKVNNFLAFEDDIENAEILEDTGIDPKPDTPPDPKSRLSNNDKRNGTTTPKTLK